MLRISQFHPSWIPGIRQDMLAASSNTSYDGWVMDGMHFADGADNALLDLTGLVTQASAAGAGSGVGDVGCRVLGVGLAR